jgi:hypothetical protein
MLLQVGLLQALLMAKVLRAAPSSCSVFESCITASAETTWRVAAAGAAGFFWNSARNPAPDSWTAVAACLAASTFDLICTSYPAAVSCTEVLGCDSIALQPAKQMHATEDPLGESLPAGFVLLVRMCSIRATVPPKGHTR